MNEELISSAVTFLKDPNVVSSPLAKKVEFLESKGLNQVEIEEALKRANSDVASIPQTAPASTAPVQVQAPIDYYNAAPPQLPDRSWKDYFIMATATVGVTYGLYQVVNRYLIPSILPAKQSSIDQDKERINEEFIKIDKLLEVLESDQREIKEQNESKLKEIDVVIDNVNDFLTKYNKDKLKFDDDLRLMKLELDNLRNSIEKNMSLTKDNIKDELEEIGEEITSLKNLIKARGELALVLAAKKVPPVSSIPSASEILKRAKAKSSSPDTPVAPTTSEAPKAEPESQVPDKREGETTVGNITAAGIPAWQLKHKEQEQQVPEQSGIPSWQTNSDEVKKAIDNVGVPSWQLNSK